MVIPVQAIQKPCNVKDKKMTYKEYSSDAIFSRGEATTNAAKMLAGIEALDDEVLEAVYSRAKAERRERGLESTVEEGFVSKYPTGNFESLSRYPDGSVKIRYNFGGASFDKTFSSMWALTNFLKEK